MIKQRIICFLWFIFSLHPSATAKVVEKTLAEVNGQMISLLDVLEAQKRWKRGFMKDSVLESLFKKTRLRTKKLALEYLTYEMLLNESAQSLNIPIHSTQIKQELKKRRKRRKLSKRDFSRLLVRNQFTAASYKTFLKKNLLRKILIQREVLEKIRISDNDLNEYATRKQGKPLFSSFEYDLEFLFFPPVKRGKKEANKTLKLLSQDPAYFDRYQPVIKGAKKRRLTKQKLQSLHPKIRVAVKNLSVGQYSYVLFIPQLGYHIFKVIWKTPIIQNRLRQKQLSDQLFKTLFHQQLKAWLEQKKAKAFIRVNL